jgi:hypothetical protein
MYSVSINQLNPFRPWSDIDAAGLTEVRVKIRSGPLAVDQVEIGHPADWRPTL